MRCEKFAEPNTFQEFSRECGQQIRIGDDITVRVLTVRRGAVVVVVGVPGDVRVEACEEASAAGR
jgi:sRNA-binding carbon storage regulator CsrA